MARSSARVGFTGGWMAAVLVVASCTGPKPEGPVRPGIAREQSKQRQAEIILLGTIHGLHQKNRKYSVEVLTDLIVQLRPAAILIELPDKIEDRPTVENGRVVGWLLAPENVAANAAADTLQVPVIPFDQPRRNEILRAANYFEREKRAYAALGVWLGQMADRDSESPDFQTLGVMLSAVRQAQSDFMRSAGPKVVNSVGFDGVILAKKTIQHKLGPRILEKYPDQQDLAQEFRFFAEMWTERNEIMVSNIAKIAGDYPDKRLVVLTGCEHRYILGYRLRDKKEITLKEYWEVLPNGGDASEGCHYSGEGEDQR